MSSSGARPARYLALIYLKPGQRACLRHHENQALPVLRRHEDVPLRAYFASGA